MCACLSEWREEKRVHGRAGKRKAREKEKRGKEKSARGRGGAGAGEFLRIRITDNAQAIDLTRLIHSSQRGDQPS